MYLEACLDWFYMLREYPEAEYYSREVSWKLVMTTDEPEMPYPLYLCLCLNQAQWTRHICKTHSTSRDTVLLISEL
jgi:hypothetical protein